MENEVQREENTLVVEVVEDLPTGEADKKNLNNNGSKQIAGAILIAGIMIAGAVLLRGNIAPKGPIGGNLPTNQIAGLPPVTSEDYMLGKKNAKVTIIEYADFQCPFCEKFHIEIGETIIKQYINEGKVNFVYRDYAFLGPESVKSAEAARCAGDQNKFWEYHDYLFLKQGGENVGVFADNNLKSFASDLGLNTTLFNTCLDSGTHKSAVEESVISGTAAGVQGTPKGFILRDGKVFATIDGAEPLPMVKAKLEAALK